MRALLLSTFFLFALSLSAQYEKGNWYLSTATQLGENQSLLDRFSHEGLEGRAGYFLSKRFLVGGTVNSGGRGFSVGSFARYYLPTNNPKLNLFAELGASFNFGRREGLSILPAAGVEYQVVPGLLLTADLRYTTATGRSLNRVGLNLDLNVLLGGRDTTARAPDYLRRRGDLLLGGRIANLSIGSIGSFRSLTGGATFSASYFLGNQFAVDAAFYFSAAATDLGTEAARREYFGQDVAASVGGTYYLLPGRRFQPYAGAGVSFRHEYRRDEREDRPRYSLSENRMAGYGKVGFLHHFNERLALDFNVRYISRLAGNTRGPGYFAGGLGVRFLFGKR